MSATTTTAAAPLEARSIENVAVPAAGSAADVPPPQPPPQPPPLMRKAIRGSAWTFFGFGSGQVLRFGSNLAVVWALGHYADQAFGLMAIVTIFMVGLQMFSDIGVTPALIQNPRGDDPDFYNTAFTIQAIRGVILALLAAAIAYPISRFWYPQLLHLLPVVGLSALLSGLNSTNIPRLNRHLRMGPITLLELATQFVGAAVMVIWALVHPTVWALVAGNLAAAGFRAAVSHVIMAGAPINRWRWDTSAVRELFHFGRWLTLGTIITFLAGQIDRLIYGRLMPQAMMGVFWQGVQLAELMPNLSKQLGGSVGFAALADLHRRDRARFFRRLLHLRAALVLPINLGLLAMIALGPALVWTIYPVRFFAVGWIIQVLAVNSLAGMVNTSYGHAYLASGRTFSGMVVVAAMLVVMVAAPLTGYGLGGGDGFILAIACTQWVLYPVYAFLSARGGHWQRRFDFAVLITTGLLALGALYLSILILGSETFHHFSVATHGYVHAFIAYVKALI